MKFTYFKPIKRLPRKYKKSLNRYNQFIIPFAKHGGNSLNDIRFYTNPDEWTHLLHINLFGIESFKNLNNISRSSTLKRGGLISSRFKLIYGEEKNRYIKHFIRGLKQIN